MSYRWGEFVLSHLYVFCFLVLFTALARNLFEIVAKKNAKTKDKYSWSVPDLGGAVSSLCPMLVMRFCRHPLLRKSLSSLTFLIAIFNLYKLNSFTLIDAFT